MGKFSYATSFLRSRHELCCRNLEIPLCAETRSRHGLVSKNEGGGGGGCDLVFVSRPGLGLGRRNDVATLFEVATSFGLLGVATWIRVAIEAGCLGVS